MFQFSCRPLSSKRERSLTLNSIEILQVSSTSSSLPQKNLRAKDVSLNTKPRTAPIKLFNTSSKGQQNKMHRRQKKRSVSLKQKQNSLEIDAQQITKRSKSLESKSFYKLWQWPGRGGIAVVWLGQKDGNYYAMKQFPKPSTGKVDPSALVEL